MKTIIRNFINVLIRFKVATFLNVAGLAVAFRRVFNYHDASKL